MVRKPPGTISIAGLGNDTKSYPSRVNVLVEGGPPELGNEKSCVNKVDPSCSVAPMIDQYSPISNEEQLQQLDRFADRLRCAT